MVSSIKICGQSKTSNIIGKITVKILKRMGYHVYGLLEPNVGYKYGIYHITISDRELIKASFEDTDILLAMNNEAITREWKSLNRNSHVFLSNELKITEFKRDIKKKNITVFKIQSDNQIEDNSYLNTSYLVLLSALLKFLSVDKLTIKETVISASEKKSLNIKSGNIKSIDYGYKSISRKEIPKKYKDCQFKKSLQDDLLLDASKSIALGLLESNCHVVGHALSNNGEISGILKFLTNLQNSVDIQISRSSTTNNAVGKVLGANYVGTRAAVLANSMDLSSAMKMLSAASLIECPMVLISEQKAGAGKQFPYSSAQSQLFSAIYGGHGEFPRLVLAPADVEECFTMTQIAFNLADFYQLPVIILVENHLFRAKTPIAFNKLKQLEMNTGKIIKRSPRNYHRYEITKDGVSPRAIPGYSHFSYQTTTFEHDEQGRRVKDIRSYSKMVEKRTQKIKTLTEDLPDPELFGPPNGNITLVGYGNIKSTILQALNAINDENESTNYLHYSYMYPFKTDILEKLVARGNEIVVIDNNNDELFSKLIRSHTKIRINKVVQKKDGRLFYVNDFI